MSKYSRLPEWARRKKKPPAAPRNTVMLNRIRLNIPRVALKPLARLMGIPSGTVFCAAKRMGLVPAKPQTHQKPVMKQGAPAINRMMDLAGRESRRS